MIVTIKGHTEMAGHVSELTADLVVIIKALRISVGKSIGEDAAEVLIRDAIKRGMEGNKDDRSI